MIELIQSKSNMLEISNLITKVSEISLHVNKELIESDIERLKKELNETNNKFNILNIKALIKYLKKILKYTNEDSVFEIGWNIDKDNLPCTYPLKLFNEPLYKVDVCNYIELDDNEHIVEIDTTEVADIIAFEIMFKDLGETHDSIEHLLRYSSVVGLESSSTLTDFFNENGDKVYELSKSMKIGETPYYSPELNKVHDYFHSKTFKTSEYREVVKYSCTYASAIIANNIVKNATHNGLDIKMLMVNDTQISFIINTDIDNCNKLLDEIYVRAFGRKFVVKPKISLI